jgi:hypothetical protein
MTLSRNPGIRNRPLAWLLLLVSFPEASPAGTMMTKRRLFAALRLRGDMVGLFHATPPPADEARSFAVDCQHGDICSSNQVSPATTIVDSVENQLSLA